MVRSVIQVTARASIGARIPAPATADDSESAQFGLFRSGIVINTAAPPIWTFTPFASSVGIVGARIRAASASLVGLSVS